MARELDLAVIGSGVAARSAARSMAAEGWSVGVIDRRPLGGTCMLRGCDPKKILVDAAAAVDQVHRMRGQGITGDARIDWAELMAFKRSFTDPAPEGQERMYADAGIAVLHGTARFTGRNSLDVGGEEVKARHVLIASGARPVKLGIPGEEHMTTHEGFMELESLPGRVVFVGGGYIAAEFSTVAARAGAQVTILQRGERMLTPFDPDMVECLTESFPRLGIDLRTGAQVAAVRQDGGSLRVEFEKDGASEEIEADLVVHAAGRVPDLAELDLERGGVASEQGTLELDEHLRSVSNPAVFAAGDAAARRPPLTPVASRDAQVVVANLKGGAAVADDSVVPSVAFTVPPIASVGIGEKEARERGIDVATQDASGWFTARHARAPVYAFKTIVEKESGRILGAHLVGPHAEEVVNIFALAMRQNLTKADLSETMLAYPTSGSDISSML